MKTQQMTNSMQTLLNYLNDLKLKFNEIYKDYQREEEENEKVKSNEQDNKLLNEIQTRIGQCQSNILKIFQEFDFFLLQDTLIFLLGRFVSFRVCVYFH